MEPLIGQITLFAGNFSPLDWELCQGQLLSIADYTALYSILGTQFGGDGVVTFGIPDLRGRVPVHAGTGPGLSPISIGEVGGYENVTLAANQLPVHNHAVNPQYANVGGQPSPANNFPANLGAAAPVYGNVSSGTMGLANTYPAGGSQSHENMQPWLCMNYVIATQGVYPSRN